MRTRTVPSILLGLLLCASGRAEWRLSAAAGGSFTESSDLHVIQGNSDFTVDGVRWKEHSFEMPPYYELRAEYYPSASSSIGFLVGLDHMKVYAQTDDVRRIHGTVDGAPVDTDAPMGSVVERFSISHGVNFIELGVVGRLRWQRDERFPNGRMQPYAGIALGPVINHTENRVLGGEFYDYETNARWGGQALLGVHYGISPRWGFRSELKRTRVKNTVSTSDGEARTTLESTHVVAGVTYTF